MNESTFAFYWLGIAFGIAFGLPMAQFIVWVCKLPARLIVHSFKRWRDGMKIMGDR